MRLSTDKIIFTLSYPDLDKNLDVAKMASICSKTVFIDHTSWYSGGETLIEALLEKDFKEIILDIKFIGSENEFERLAEALIKNEIISGFTIFPFQDEDVLKNYKYLLDCKARKYNKKPIKLLSSFENFIYSFDSASIYSAITRCIAANLDGFVLIYDIFDKYLRKIDLSSFIKIIRTTVPMRDYHTTFDSRVKIGLKELGLIADHILYKPEDLLIDSIIAFDVLKKDISEL